MINVVGTYASVCISKLNRLKNILLQQNLMYSSELQSDQETVVFLEQTNVKLHNLQKSLAEKKESVMNRCPTRRIDTLRNLSGSHDDLPRISPSGSVDLTSKITSNLGGDTARARRRFQNLSMVERMYSNQTGYSIDISEQKEIPLKQTAPSSGTRIGVKAGIQAKTNQLVQRIANIDKLSIGNRGPYIADSTSNHSQLISKKSLLNAKVSGALTDRVHGHSFDLFGSKNIPLPSSQNTNTFRTVTSQSKNTSLRLQSELMTPGGSNIPQPGQRPDPFKKKNKIPITDTSSKLKLDISQFGDIQPTAVERDTRKMARTCQNGTFGSGSVKINDYNIKVPHRPISEFEVSEKHGGTDGGISEDDLNMPKVQVTFRQGISSGQLKSSLYIPSISTKIKRHSVDLLNDSSEVTS